MAPQRLVLGSMLHTPLPDKWVVTRGLGVCYVSHV